MRTQINRRCMPAGVALRMSLVVHCLVMLGVGCGSTDASTAEVSPIAAVIVGSTEAAQHPITANDENVVEVGIDRDPNAAHAVDEDVEEQLNSTSSSASLSCKRKGRSCGFANPFECCSFSCGLNNKCN